MACAVTRKLECFQQADGTAERACYGLKPVLVTRMIKTLCVFSLLLVAIPTLRAEQTRPNILWITAEDMSANLGCYGDPFATTPNLDRFATESIRFTNAYATAPVCSPAQLSDHGAIRNLTRYAATSFPLSAADMVPPISGDVGDAGYFTSNNVKTDYNVRDEAKLIESAWDRNGRKHIGVSVGRSNRSSQSST